MTELTVPHPDAATTIFNLEDCRMVDARILVCGRRRIHVESIVESGCSVCGVIGTRRYSRRWQRLRDIPIAAPAEVVWVNARYFRDEQLCPRRTFCESTV